MVFVCFKLHVFVPLCTWCSVCGSQRGQQILSPLELELHRGGGVVSCLTPVLGTKLRASGRAVTLLAAEPPLQSHDDRILNHSLALN